MFPPCGSCDDQLACLQRSRLSCFHACSTVLESDLNNHILVCPKGVQQKRRQVSAICSLRSHSAAVLPSGNLLPSLQHRHSHGAEADSPLTGPGHSRLRGNPWTCDVQARPHFRRDCNAGGRLVRRDCAAGGGVVGLSLAEHAPESSKGGGAPSASEACGVPCLSSTAASWAGADADSGFAANDHASASRASHLQRLGPLGFEELLAQLELAHRQVTSLSVLGVIGRAGMVTCLPCHSLTWRILSAAMLTHDTVLTAMLSSAFWLSKKATPDRLTAA